MLGYVSIYIYSSSYGFFSYSTFRFLTCIVSSSTISLVSFRFVDFSYAFTEDYLLLSELLRSSLTFGSGCFLVFYLGSFSFEELFLGKDL